MRRMALGLAIAIAWAWIGVGGCADLSGLTSGVNGDAAAPPVDATSPDASETDAGSRDAPPPPPDAPVDATSPPPDAGTDAPPPACAIAAVNGGFVPGISPPSTPQMKQASTDQATVAETAGDLLVAVAYGGQGPGNTTPLTTTPNMTFTVSDSLGNTYYAGPMFENTNSNQAAIQIFYAANVVGGTNTVTVQSAATGIGLWTGIWLEEYSGIAATDVVDVATGEMAPTSTATVTPGNMTTTTGCGLVVTAFTDGHVGGQNLTSATGCTMRSADQWDPGASCDTAPLPVLAGAVVNFAMTLSAGPDDGWVATQVAFRGAGTTAPVQPTAIGFLTAPRTVTANTCSPSVVIQTVNGSAVATTSTGVTVALSGSELTFYADPACDYPITSAYVGAGTSSQSFYFKAAATGSPTVDANSNLGSASQVETIN